MSQDLWALGGRLVGNAIAQKRAQANAERERLAARPSRSLFRPVSAPLPVEAWHTGPNLQFGYPWGWQEVDPAGITGAPDGFQCAVAAERSDDAVANVQVMQVDSCSPDDLLDAAASLPDERTKIHGAAPEGAMEYLLVGGELALGLHMPGRTDAQKSMSTEVFTVRRRRLYLILLISPQENHRAYLQVLWTMLGTWSWA